MHIIICIASFPGRTLGRQLGLVKIVYGRGLWFHIQRILKVYVGVLLRLVLCHEQRLASYLLFIELVKCCLLCLTASLVGPMLLPNRAFLPLTK